MKRMILASCALLLAFASRSFAQDNADARASMAIRYLTDYDRLVGTVLGSQSSQANETYFLYRLAQSNLLGVEVAPVDAPMRAVLDLEEGVGVLVTSIHDDSTAAKAGLQVYDVLIQLDDKKITDADMLRNASTELAEKVVKVKLLRKGHPQELTLTIPKQPTHRLVVQSLDMVARPEEPRYRIGLHLSETDDTLRNQLRLASGEGLVVTDVVPDSPAAEVGLQAHDVLTKLDGKRLTTVDAINEQIQEIKDRKVTVTFYRNGEEKSLQVAPKLGTEPSAQWVTPVLLGDLADVELAVTGNRIEQPARIAWRDLALRLQDDSVENQLAKLKTQLEEMQKVVENLSKTIEMVKTKEEKKE